MRRITQALVYGPPLYFSSARLYILTNTQGVIGSPLTQLGNSPVISSLKWPTPSPFTNTPPRVRFSSGPGLHGRRNTMIDSNCSILGGRDHFTALPSSDQRCGRGGGLICVDASLLSTINGSDCFRCLILGCMNTYHVKAKLNESTWFAPPWYCLKTYFMG